MKVSKAVKAQKSILKIRELLEILWETVNHMENERITIVDVTKIKRIKLAKKPKKAKAKKKKA